jgi:hypothetical protein
MKCMKRGLWVAAWGVWAWLGFGLCRELPRQVGPRVCQIPINAGDTAAFIKDTHHVAVETRLARQALGLKVFDAASGASLCDTSFEWQWPLLQPLSTVRPHGVVVMPSHDQRWTGLAILDVERGRSTPVTAMTAFDVRVHPSKPWVAFRESAPPVDNPRSLVVIDWTTGTVVLARPRGVEYVRVGAPIFLGDSDQLVVPVSHPVEAGGEDKADLEVWRLGFPSRLEKVIRGQPIPQFVQASRTGRLAWSHQDTEGGRVSVYDLNAESMVFSRLVWKGPRWSGLKLEESRLSSSGRTIMTEVSTNLWDMDSGAALWTMQGWQPPVLHDDAFTEFEQWDKSWTRGTFLNWNTSAIRDLDTAALRFRCWNRDASILECCSRDGTLGVTRNGSVHRLPFRANHPLLAVCQTILGLPLVMLWAVLRWRRNRLKRMACVA